MRKFNQPFDSYELTSDSPMKVELTAYRGPFKALADNPIYYSHAFQYLYGDFYRAVLGYETIWDTDYEDSLVLALDFLLNRWAQQSLYYLEEITIDRRTKLEGVQWIRGVKPRSLNLNQRKRIKPGFKRALARVNLLDAPHHVDIEFYTGEIYTVSYMHYLRLKHRKRIRSLDHENPTRTDASHSKNDGTTATERLKSLGREDAFEAIYSQLPNLRQRVRLQKSLQKASKKARANLV